MKICSKCKQEKELDEFHKGNGKFGRKCYCKSCSLEIQNQYRDDPDKRQIAAEKSKILRMKNRAKYLLNGCKNRARDKGLDFNLTIEDIIIPEYCPILGIKLSTDIMERLDFYGPSVDRVDNSKGYIKGNIMIMSRKANIMKSSSTKEELLAFCKYFIEELKEK